MTDRLNDAGEEQGAAGRPEQRREGPHLPDGRDIHPEDHQEGNGPESDAQHGSGYPHAGCSTGGEGCGSRESFLSMGADPEGEQ